jgi:gas vesicle protein
MSENKTMQVGGFLTAFAIGAVAGAGLALLYAPRSGEETRNLIAEKGRDLKARAGSAIADAKVFIGEHTPGAAVRNGRPNA